MSIVQFVLPSLHILKISFVQRHLIYVMTMFFNIWLWYMYNFHTQANNIFELQDEISNYV